MILHTLQELRQNMNQRLNSQKTPHALPYQSSYGMSFVNILEKNWLPYNGTSLYHVIFNHDISRVYNTPVFQVTCYHYYGMPLNNGNLINTDPDCTIMALVNSEICMYISNSKKGHFAVFQFLTIRSVQFIAYRYIIVIVQWATFSNGRSVRSRIWKQLVRRTSSPKNSLVLMLS